MKKYFKVFMVFLLVMVIPYDEVMAKDFSRIGGKDRYLTSVKISETGWAQSDMVILATGEGFADALCATPLGAKFNAPILLNPQKSLNNYVKNEIVRLKAKKVFIIGGKGAISEGVEKSIENLGIACERVEGKDRYDTSYKIAEKLGGRPEVIVATASNFPDSLSVAAVAGKRQMPILLSSKESLYESSLNYIKTNNSKAYVIGGNFVIGQGVYNALPKAERISGSDRYDTNIKVINKFSQDFAGYNKVYIANGRNYPDALAGSALAAKESVPIMLVDKEPYEVTKTFAKNIEKNNIKPVVFGEEGAVSKITITKLFHDRIYTISNPKTFEIKYVIKVTNNNSYSLDNVKLNKELGSLSNSPYQYDETINLKGSGMSLYNNGDKKEARVIIHKLAPRQSLEYEITRTFKQGSLKYDVDISNTSGDYSGFVDYKKFTSPEEKIESTNAEIINKAKQVVGNEKNPYLKAKKIYAFVNSYMKYDYSQGNKGALNALRTGKGVCEDYSDLMVALCRAQGVPARVVSGFWVKDVSNSYKSLENDCHAWVEFYLPEYGWVISEPTMIYHMNGVKTVNWDYFAKLNGPGHFIEGYTGSLGYSVSATSSQGQPRVDVKHKADVRQLN